MCLPPRTIFTTTTSPSMAAPILSRETKMRPPSVETVPEPLALTLILPLWSPMVSQAANLPFPTRQSQPRATSSWIASPMSSSPSLWAISPGVSLAPGSDRKSDRILLRVDLCSVRAITSS